MNRIRPIILVFWFVLATTVDMVIFRTMKIHNLKLDIVLLFDESGTVKEQTDWRRMYKEIEKWLNRVKAENETCFAIVVDGDQEVKMNLSNGTTAGEAIMQIPKEIPGGSEYFDLCYNTTLNEILTKNGDRSDVANFVIMITYCNYDKGATYSMQIVFRISLVKFARKVKIRTDVFVCFVCLLSNNTGGRMRLLYPNSVKKYVMKWLGVAFER